MSEWKWGLLAIGAALMIGGAFVAYCIHQDEKWKAECRAAGGTPRCVQTGTTVACFPIVINNMTYLQCHPQPVVECECVRSAMPATSRP